MSVAAAPPLGRGEGRVGSGDAELFVGKLYGEGVDLGVGGKGEERLSFIGPGVFEHGLFERVARVGSKPLRPRLLNERVVAVDAARRPARVHRVSAPRRARASPPRR